MFCQKNKKTSSRIEADRKKIQKKKKIEKKFRKKKKFNKKKIGKKNFVRKKISQNVFWINWGSGEHEEKFLEVERRRERSKT